MNDNKNKIKLICWTLGLNVSLFVFCFTLYYFISSVIGLYIPLSSQTLEDNIPNLRSLFVTNLLYSSIFLLTTATAFAFYSRYFKKNRKLAEDSRLYHFIEYTTIIVVIANFILELISTIGMFMDGGYTTAMTIINILGSIAAIGLGFFVFLTKERESRSIKFVTFFVLLISAIFIGVFGYIGFQKYGTPTEIRTLTDEYKNINNLFLVANIIDEDRRDRYYSCRTSSDESDLDLCENIGYIKINDIPVDMIKDEKSMIDLFTLLPFEYQLEKTGSSTQFTVCANTKHSPKQIKKILGFEIREGSYFEHKITADKYCLVGTPDNYMGY